MGSQSAERYINRELSWLEFNGRVLSEALRSENPPLERLRFLCIVSNNLDEFFMVRVASVKRQIIEGNRSHCPSGALPSVVLADLTSRVGRMLSTANRCLVGEIIPALADEGLAIKRPAEYTEEQSAALRSLFHDEVFPVLTPVRVEADSEFPYTANLKLHVAFLLEPRDDAGLLAADPEADPEAASGESVAVVQIPSSLDRLIALPEHAGRTSFALLEDVIVKHAKALFPGCRILEHCVFRVTRDADLGVDEERDEDFVEAMQQILARREHSRPTRLSVSNSAGRLKTTLSEALGIPDEEVLKEAEILALAGLMRLAGEPGFDHLRNTPWIPTLPLELANGVNIWDVLRKRDVLLHHPYESFDPVVRLVQEAATDPGVLSIKITLYRTSGDSPIVRALEEAAGNGKQVTAVVEIKARFDEERNISWAIRLQRAGVIVVYGIARLKVHAKALLIVRRDQGGISRYVHLGTGNYNDGTARLYTDFGLMTTRQDLAYEAALFFNAITGYSAVSKLQKLAMAPVSLKPKILQLIERETLRASSGETGLILAKMNSLADPEVIDALYSASQAGVSVKLNIRGLCMLRPGVKDLSDNIEVVSIIDRYLEHGRVFYFQNGGAPELYCSSADWMPRNLERRVELMFPIEDEDARARIVSSIQAAFRDNNRSHRIGPDGHSTPVRPRDGDDLFESQRHHQLVAEARAAIPHGEDQRSFEVRRRPPEA